MKQKHYFFLLLLTIYSFYANAQCPPSGSKSSSYLGSGNFTEVKCSSGGYFVSGTYPLYGTPRPPLSNINVVATSATIGGVQPTVTFNGIDFVFENFSIKSNNNVISSMRITYTDSCNNTDTLILQCNSNINFELFNQQTGLYDLCDSVYRTEIRTKMSGLHNFSIKKYNYTNNQYEPFPAQIEYTGDSLKVKGVYPDPGSQNLGQYMVSFVDTCGKDRQVYINSYLSNYSLYADLATYTCNNQGLTIQTIKPNLRPPYTLTNTIANAYSPLVDTFIPQASTLGDSIVISNVAPYTPYQFFFTDGCGSPFTVNYYAYTIDSGYYEANFLGKTCDTTFSMYFLLDDTSVFYNPIFESNPQVNLTARQYGDSLVIDGFPLNTDMNEMLIVSFRDSTCHNRKYSGFYHPYLSFLNNNFSNLNYIDDSCTGDGYRRYAILPGQAPYTEFTQLHGINNLTYQINNDTITFGNLGVAVNFLDDSLYVFSIKDACGKTDTFKLSSSSIWSNTALNLTYETGGCSGVDNAAVTFNIVDHSYPTPYNGPYNFISIEGPGNPVVQINGSKINLTQLKNLSTYKFHFIDTCGHSYFYEYTSQESNTPITLNIKSSIEGTCIPEDSFNQHLALNVQSTGVNYPCNVYLSGNKSDSLIGIDSSNFSFYQLTPGNYTVTIEDACNNIYTQNYTLQGPNLVNKYTYVYLDKYVDCDSFDLNYQLTYNVWGNVQNQTVNLKFNGPYTGFVVRNNDTITAYNPDTTINIYNYQVVSLRFPKPSSYSNYETYYIVDGCGDTVSNVYGNSTYFSYRLSCDSGSLANTYTIDFQNNKFSAFQFPVTLTSSIRQF